MFSPTGITSIVVIIIALFITFLARSLFYRLFRKIGLDFKKDSYSDTAGIIGFVFMMTLFSAMFVGAVIFVVLVFIFDFVDRLEWFRENSLMILVPAMLSVYIFIFMYTIKGYFGSKSKD